MEELIFHQSKGPFVIVFELVFSKNKNENDVLQLLYFKFKYVFGIIFCILYFKTQNSNMCSVYIIENDKNNEYVFGSTDA